MVKERTYREFRKMKRKYEHLLIGMSSNNEQICRDFETNTLFCNYKESHKSHNTEGSGAENVIIDMITNLGDCMYNKLLVIQENKEKLETLTSILEKMVDQQYRIELLVKEILTITLS